MHCRSILWGCRKRVPAPSLPPVAGGSVRLGSTFLLCTECAEKVSRHWGVNIAYLKDLEWAIGWAHRARGAPEGVPVPRDAVWPLLDEIKVPYDKDQAAVADREHDAVVLEHVREAERDLPQGDRLL